MPTLEEVRAQIAAHKQKETDAAATQAKIRFERGESELKAIPNMVAKALPVILERITNNVAERRLDYKDNLPSAMNLQSFANELQSQLGAMFRVWVHWRDDSPRHRTDTTYIWITW